MIAALLAVIVLMLIGWFARRSAQTRIYRIDSAAIALHWRRK